MRPNIHPTWVALAAFAFAASHHVAVGQEPTLSNSDVTISPLMLEGFNGVLPHFSERAIRILDDGRSNRANIESLLLGLKDESRWVASHLVLCFLFEERLFRMNDPPTIIGLELDFTAVGTPVPAPSPIQISTLIEFWKTRVELETSDTLISFEGLESAEPLLLPSKPELHLALPKTTSINKKAFRTCVEHILDGKSDLRRFVFLLEDEELFLGTNRLFHSVFLRDWGVGFGRNASICSVQLLANGIPVKISSNQRDRIKAYWSRRISLFHKYSESLYFRDKPSEPAGSFFFKVSNNIVFVP